MASLTRVAHAASAVQCVRMLPLQSLALPAPSDLSIFETIHMRSANNTYSPYFMYCGQIMRPATLVVLSEPTMSGERERQVRAKWAGQ